jgi:2-dehydro-3-deoxyglucarate aldolase
MPIAAKGNQLSDGAQQKASSMRLKSRLRAGELTIGSWITVGHPVIAEIMARAGFDWLVIDMEHSVIDVPSAQSILQATLAYDTPVIVRLTSNERDLIKRVMDAGAAGVMAPSISSVQDAQRLIDSVYYPPRGSRGVGLARAQGYGAGFDEYRAWLEQEAVVIAMLEHKDAVEHADAILSLDGIDGYMIGPYDLSSSLGKPGNFADPSVAAAIRQIREAGVKAGKPGGIHVVDPDRAALRQRIDEGFQFIGYGMDIRYLDCMCREHLGEIRRRK